MSLNMSGHSINFVQVPEDKTYTGHEDDQMAYWSDIDLIDTLKSLYSSGELYRFMDGPPFVSGKLHLGHFAVSSMKSMVLNYKGQRGMLCLNRLGYDCHGLPVENLIFKKYGYRTIDDVKTRGEEEFTERCMSEINFYSNPSNPESWPPSLLRIGRWADYMVTYRTCDRPYMESVLWVFSVFFKKGLVYIGFKVVPFSTACQTALSNFEATQNYREKLTKSVFVLFPVLGEENTYFVVWTTTAWTLPSNMALCVGPDIEYVKVESEGKFYYISANTAPKLFKKGKYKIVKTMKGTDLEGKRYKPIFPYFKDDPKLFRVITNSYVKDLPTTSDKERDDSGTGIVHESAPFGEEDFNICVENGIVTNTTVQNYCTVNEFGEFNDLVPDFKGMHVHDDETTKQLIIRMKEMGLFMKTYMYKHNYPYCWRTDTPLIYRVVESVFIKVSAITDQMLALNEAITWHPKHIGERRFKNWLANARDWAVSRTRFFGTPIPIWRSEDGDMICVGSCQELADLTGKSPEDFPDLHKHHLDKVVIQKNGKTYHRVPYIFDCWFESGSVPFGQIHYPFENRELIDDVDYLSDFIVEGLDQTRGWFYTLLVIATAITDGKKVPFKNVICTGMILDESGNKFSKRLGNNIDINDYLKRYGADVIRTYLISSPLVNAEPLLLNQQHIDILKKNQIRYINSMKFFLEYASNFQRQGHTFRLLGKDMDFSEVTSVFDKWILSRLTILSDTYVDHMENYRLNKAVDVQLGFIEDLVNWYIQFNRSRMKGIYDVKEWSDSLSVLHFVLHTYARICSAATPFISEYVHRNIYLNVVPDSPKSIHYMPYPSFPSMKDEELDKTFHYLKIICDSVRTLRSQSSTHSSVRVPLKRCVVYHDDSQLLQDISDNIHMVQENVNCIDIDFNRLEGNVSYVLEPMFKDIGKTFRKDTGKVVKALKKLKSADIATMVNKESYELVIGDKTFSVPKDCYTIIKCPADTESSLMTKIVGDIMVGIDTTYDKSVENDYIAKVVHSTIQNVRKNLKLHPWDKISVTLSEEFAKSIPDLDERLRSSLSNADVYWTAPDDEECEHKLHVNTSRSPSGELTVDVVAR